MGLNAEQVEAALVDSRYNEGHGNVQALTDMLNAAMLAAQHLKGEQECAESEPLVDGRRYCSKCGYYFQGPDLPTDRRHCPNDGTKLEPWRPIAAKREQEPAPALWRRIAKEMRHEHDIGDGHFSTEEVELVEGFVAASQPPQESVVESRKNPGFRWQQPAASQPPQESGVARRE